MKICFISRYDSFVRLACNYAIRFKQLKWDVVFVLLDQNKLSKFQVKNLKEELNFYNIILVPYKKEILEENDIIFLSLTGGYIKKILRTIATKKERPYLVAAYPGVVYQNIIDGFASRSLCDLIIFPSFKEKNEYDLFCETNDLLNAGIVGGYFEKKKYEGQDFSDDVVFAEQTVVPNTIYDRLYLAKKLIEFAEANPNRRLFIKPRNGVSGKSLFKTKLHIIQAFKATKRGKLPKNLIITFKPIEYYTSQGALCLTISSTAAIETLQFHNKIAFITDFGPSENNGGSYFNNSNAEYTFHEITYGKRNTINKEWKKQVYVSNNKCINQIIERIIADLKENRKIGIINSCRLFSTDYLKEKKLRLSYSFEILRYCQLCMYKILNLFY